MHVVFRLHGKCAGEKPTLKDWETHLTTIFPEVRLKRYMEMRGADGGPSSAICALPALWVGLLYDRSACLTVFACVALSASLILRQLVCWFSQTLRCPE